MFVPSAYPEAIGLLGEFAALPIAVTAPRRPSIYPRRIASPWRRCKIFCLAWHAESGCSMNLDEWHSLPNELVARLEAARVQEYVLQTGWLHQPELGHGLSSLFRRPELDLEQISIPLQQGASYYPRYMRDVLVYIAAWEKRPALELLYELLLPPADLLFFRESGSAVGSIDIPLDQGLNLLAGVRKLLLAAAHGVRHEELSHPNGSLAGAESFVRRCRLAQIGHPFTVAVACPVNAVSDMNGSAQVPFSRRVTTLLMRSLQRMARVLEDDNLDESLHPVPGEPVISSDLWKGLLDITPEGDRWALTISVSWSRILPPPDAIGLPSELRLGAETFDRLEALAERLRPAFVETSALAAMCRKASSPQPQKIDQANRAA